jgi:lipopolysaccharide/colanic/teichoic acid biosynthesis glycosyltransferase
LTLRGGSRDVFLALVALIAFAPLMLLGYAAVCADGGPGLTLRRRVRRDGRAVWCHAFRTVIAKSGARGASHRLRATALPVPTPVGAILRRTGMENLPHLINILKGEIGLQDMLVEIVV